jgi:hypothetical protein
MKIKFILLLYLYLSVCYYYVEGTTTQEISQWVTKLSNLEMYNPQKKTLFNDLAKEVEEVQSLSVFDDPNEQGNDPMKIQFLQSLTNVFQHVQEIRSIVEIYQGDNNYPEFIQKMVHQTRMIRKMTETWKESTSIKSVLKEIMLVDVRSYLMHILGKKDMYDPRKKTVYNDLYKLVQSFSLLNLNDFYDPVTSQFLQSLTNIFRCVQKIRSYVENYGISAANATGACRSYIDFITEMRRQAQLILKTITMWEMKSLSVHQILQKIILSGADMCLSDNSCSENLISTLREEMINFLQEAPSLATYQIISSPLKLLLNPLTTSPDDLELIIEFLFHLAPTIYRDILIDPQCTPEQIQDWNDCMRRTILMSDQSASVIAVFMNQIIVFLRDVPTLSTYQTMSMPLQVLMNHRNVDGHDRQRIVDSLLHIAPKIYYDILDYQYFLSQPAQVFDWIEFATGNLLMSSSYSPVIAILSRVTFNLKIFLKPRNFVPDRISLTLMFQNINKLSRKGTLCWEKDDIREMVSEVNDRYRDFQKHMTKVYLILANGMIFHDTRVVRITVDSILTTAKQSMKKSALLFWWRELDMDKVQTLIYTVKFFHQSYREKDCEKLSHYYIRLSDDKIFIPYDDLFVLADHQSTSIHLSEQERAVLKKFSGKNGKNYVKTVLRKKYEDLCS